MNNLIKIHPPFYHLKFPNLDSQLVEIYKCIKFFKHYLEEQVKFLFKKNSMVPLESSNPTASKHLVTLTVRLLTIGFPGLP